MSGFAFKRTGDADYPQYLKVLVQGPPKSGKTTFISSAPNVVVAACEAGLASIAHLDIAYVDITGTEDLQKLEMVLRDETLRDHAARQLGIPKIETVAIDTLDAWQEILKKEVLAENKRSQLQMADWGTIKERMAAILKRFVSLPLNVIFTVHTTTTQDDEQRLIYAPALQGSIKDEVAGYVDYSLLAFRDRQTDKQGVGHTIYALKTEGDAKNPHLGNRGAGRLPEIARPSFTELHRLHFAPIGKQRSSAPVIAEEATAQSVSQPTTMSASAAALTAVIDKPKPTGVPTDDPDKPINASGVTMLTKSYTEHSLTVPEDLKTWTLAKGRVVAKWFMAWKADRAAGQGVTREDLIEGLKAYDAFTGELDGVQTGTDGLKSAKAADAKPDAADASPASTEPAKAEVKPDDESAEEAAVALVKTELGGVEIAHQASPDATCAECGNPVDEPDIANLAVIKFKKPLCLKDYKAAVKAANK